MVEQEFKLRRSFQGVLSALKVAVSNAAILVLGPFQKILFGEEVQISVLLPRCLRPYLLVFVAQLQKTYKGLLH